MRTVKDGDHHVAENGDEIRLGDFIVEWRDGQLYVGLGPMHLMVIEPRSQRELILKVLK